MGAVFSYSLYEEVQYTAQDWFQSLMGAVFSYFFL